jgi:hypothetical protein
VICGDAIGNLTPLGPLVGEPAKAAFVRGRVALAPALTALAIENVLYTLSAAAMIASGMVALLVRFSCRPMCAASASSRSPRPSSSSSRRCGCSGGSRRSSAGLSAGPAAAQARRSDQAARGRRSTRSRPGIAARLPALAVAELGFHVLGVAEIY